MNMKNTLITFLLLIAAITASAQDFSVFQGGAGSNIRPEGWLKEFLLRQKSGMTGHPEILPFQGRFSAPGENSGCEVKPVRRF